MKLIKKGSSPKVDRSDAPIFYGGKVTGETIVGPGASKYFSFNQVNFAAGAKNHFHTHSSDQILFATHGKGIVANEKEQLIMEAGDTALIPAGEKHWHGATDDSAFSHIALTHPESKTEVFPS
jgi:quercetin dioxygenase-like cupin family protein